MTREEERSVERSYDRSELGWSYDGPSIQVPPRDHLGTERRPGVCCDHSWEAVPRTAENWKLLQETFREQDVGENPQRCLRCGALALFDVLPDFRDEERQMLWAYDASVRFGMSREERKDGPPQRRGPRERR